MEAQTNDEANGRGVRPPNAPIRGRPQLSCTPCKRRKLKCDRARPCDNCVKRREADTCVYPASGSVPRDQTRESKKTKKRIERLESLVMELLERGAPNHESYSEGPSTSESESQSQVHFHMPPHASENGQDTDSSPGQRDGFAIRRPSDLAGSSSSSSLWESVLQDIGEIKLYFEENESEFQKQLGKVEDARTPALEPYALESDPFKWDIDTFLPYVPPRNVVDILVANYFSPASFVRPIIHPKKFLREYEKFWDCPARVSKIWLGVLFTIMRLAIFTAREQSTVLTPALGDMDETMTLYRMRAKQILLTELHTQPSIEKLELWTLFIDAEFLQCQDTSTSIWVTLSTAIRMAMKLGLHRDPSLYGNLTPFECEMRRRLWLGLVQIDILTSWQVGLPSMIPRGQCDTMLPKNLHEEDFDEDSVVLPLSRPWNEMTKISTFIAKAPLLAVFAKVASHILDIHPKDSEIPILEQELYAARDSLPSIFKVRSMQESILDHPSVILRRMGIDQALHSGLCVLHRRHLPLARSNPRYSHSRKTAIDAAMTLLSYQAITHRETDPTQRLAGQRWLATSIIRHDYLLAAMLICLDLRQGIEGKTHPASSDITLWGRDRREEMMTALENSYNVWYAYKEISIDAFRASEAVAVLLKKVRSAEEERQKSESTVSSIPSVESLEISPEQFIPAGTNPYNLSLPFSEMVASPSAIDWVEFDRFVMGGNVPRGQNM